MKFRKADEMERYQNEKSAKYTFMFYTIALLVWSLIDFITKGKTGWEFTILLAGSAIFFWSRVIYNRKMR